MSGFDKWTAPLSLGLSFPIYIAEQGLRNQEKHCPYISWGVLVVLENENLSEFQKLSYNVYVYIQKINAFSTESCNVM